MTERDPYQYNGNSRRDKKESILRNILKVREELDDLQEEVSLTDRIDGASSCETVILDNFTINNEENTSIVPRTTFSDDSLEGSVKTIIVADGKKLGNVHYQRNNVLGSVTSTSLKVSGEKPFKRQSMIPKLSRNSKLRDSGKTNLLEQKELHRSNTSVEPKKISTFIRAIGKTNTQVCNNAHSHQKAITPPLKLFSLQQKLKATTSIIKHKMENGNAKDLNTSNNKITCVKSTSSSDVLGTKKPTTLGSLYKNLAQIRETASVLAKVDNFRNQKGHIEKLFKNISEIQNIADKLTEIEREPDKFKGIKLKSALPKKQDSSYSQSKENNKAHVKFMQKIYKRTKDNSEKSLNEYQYPKPKKLRNEGEYICAKPVVKPQNPTANRFKKKKEIILEKSVDKSRIETGLELAANLETLDLNSKTTKDIQSNKKSKQLKEIDSMDGIFIPFREPPSNIDEEDESCGFEDEASSLDITIPFPELKNVLYKPVSNPVESQLSLRLSEISADAIKTLKRCPKDFTLRMDFIQGRVPLQTAKTLVNNISHMPASKFTELSIDEKKSDIINIKQSTECAFASQLISVDSYQSLRAADSEIFNSVNVPLVYKNKSRNTIAITSCATFNENDVWSVALLTKQHIMSMPEIADISNMLEDAKENMTGFDDTSSQKEEKYRETDEKHNVK